MVQYGVNVQLKGGGSRKSIYLHMWIRQSFHNQTEVIFLIGHFCSKENGRVDIR